ncbi:hypothetical protein GDO86_000568 [Hymenochirus boettgeri]|uniref:Uncharacterized protein n=1 Tax=Hymenochirus boettgeri TaxID=247094 RepID=A0A8T2KCH5_9PIPI|nr:hypothetical protein GDO86_000568 [Hymenochirus boettgeri]
MYWTLQRTTVFKHIRRAKYFPLVKARVHFLFTSLEELSRGKFISLKIKQNKYAIYLNVFKFANHFFKSRSLTGTKIRSSIVSWY